MATVSILMASYNSANYLSQQLDSIVSQNYREWNLYIRDDGSRDQTVDIIEEYVKKDKRIHLVKDENSGLGAAGSFLRLLATIDSDYYFFADHDDVWMPSKVDRTIYELHKATMDNPGMPVIVHSDLVVVDKELNIIHSSFWQSSGIKPNVIANKLVIQVFNCVTGCTMAFNLAAKQVSFPYPELVPMHDWWLTISSLWNGGKVLHIKEPLIYYRQHGRNEVGARKVDGGYFVQKLKQAGETLDGHRKHIEFLKSVDGIGIFRYYLIKVYYTLIRKI